MPHYRKVHVDNKVYEWCRTDCGGFFVKGVGKHPFENYGFTDEDFDLELGYREHGMPHEVVNFIKRKLSENSD